MIAYSYRFFRSRPRLLAGIITGVACFFVLHMLAINLPVNFGLAKAYLDMETVSQVLIAWNVGVWTYLIAVFYMMYYADEQRILDKARSEDAGTALMIVLVLMTAVVSVVAIVQELGVSKDAKGILMAFHVGLTFTTIVTAWLFIHTMFALHYTHTYYLALEKYKKKHKHDGEKSVANKNADTPKDPHILDFPNEDKPNYWDFLYFSYIIGTSAQTADVSFTSRKIRQLGTVHCLLAFFFNVAVMSLMINLASGLIGN